MKIATLTIDVDASKLAARPRSAVMVATSRDAGRTWGTPVTVADGSRRARVPTPATDARGQVALTWYEDRGALVGAVSRDRGRTWTIRDLANRLDVESAPANNAAGGWRFGDYTGLVAGRRGFVSVASLPEPYAKHGPTDLFATRFGG